MARMPRSGYHLGVTVTRDERLQLADLFDEVGPDRPTLCEGWHTRELLAHLLVRERRPDAAVGIVVPALAGHTAKVMAETAHRPFDELVAAFRAGPPPWALPWALPVVGDQMNLFEFFVHHEDVRRAADDWESRPDDERRDDALWNALRPMARLLFRRSPVGVVLRASGRSDVVAHRGPSPVIVVGLPPELALVAFGRPTNRARVVVQGEPEDVAAFEAAGRGF